MSSFPTNLPPLGVQVGLSVGASTAVALTVPSGAVFALISVETNSVRFTDAGALPTSSSGVLLNVTTAEPFTYASEAGLSALRFIATSSTATLSIAFYG